MSTVLGTSQRELRTDFQERNEPLSGGQRLVEYLLVSGRLCDQIADHHSSVVQA